MWHGSIIIVASETVQQRLLKVEIPRLQQWLPANKPIRTGDTWPSHDFQGLLLTSPEAWLKGQLADNNPFPANIPTIIDGVDDLEDWVRSQLTQSIEPHDWDQLMLAYPYQADLIREVRVELTYKLFQHPENPYSCYLISQPEIEILQELHIAKTKLIAQGVRNDLDPNGSKLGWENYLRDVGLSKETVRRWLSRYNPDTKVILPKEIEGNGKLNTTCKCPNCNYEW
jgi:Rad3-related DNA helicase